MHITIGHRAKSTNCLPSNRPSISAQPANLSPQRQQCNPRQSLNEESPCDSSRFAKWAMGKCLAKTNSILEEQPPTSSSTIAKQQKLVHSLSSRRPHKDTSTTQQIQTSNLSTSKDGNAHKAKHVKIKLETCREKMVTGRILRLKACQGALHSPTQPTSCTSSSHASREKLSAKQSDSSPSIARLLSAKEASHTPITRIETIIQAKLSSTKLERLKTSSPKSSQSRSLLHLESEHNEPHLWEKDSQEKHRIEDCIYEPIFTVSSASRPTRDSRTVASPKINSKQRVESALPISTKDENTTKEQYASDSGMFVIYQKNDEAFEFQ